jgi:3-methyl-2-oxobutanoate hydroxymethyltransferase
MPSANKTATAPKKKTILDLQQMKDKGEKAVWVVAYDACMASYAEKAGMDMILVGDSMGMIVYGYPGTVPVSMDMSIFHCQAVRRGAPDTYVIGDMPFGSYHESAADAVHNAVRFLKEADVDAIKLEGGVAVKDKIEAICKSGIVVFGHIGLTPQSSAALGGFKVQGKSTAGALAVLNDARALYEAGARCLLIEGVPEVVTAFVAKSLPIPVYGIGAGVRCDGQVLLAADLLGMYEAFTPKFSKRYMNLAHDVTNAFREYVEEAKAGAFPAPEHMYKYTGDEAELQKLFADYKFQL